MAGIMLPPMAEGEGRGGGERGRGEEEGKGERRRGKGRGGGERKEGEERGNMTKEHSHEIAGSHLMSNLHFCWMWKALEKVYRRCHKIHCNSVILQVGMDWCSWVDQINKSVSVPYPTLVLPWQCAAH